MGHKKFDQHTNGKYWENYFERDRDFYNAIKSHISKAIPAKNTFGIDIGAGPGIGARLIEELNLEAILIGYEPSKTFEDGEELAREFFEKSRKITYTSLNGGMSDVFVPGKNSFDYVLILRAAHEISESLGSKNNFFDEMKRVLTGLKESGSLIIAEPQYFKKNPGKKLIETIQEYQMENIGHYHIPSDYITEQQMRKQIEKMGLAIVKETIIPNDKLLNHLNEKGFTLDKSPCGFFIQTYQK